jgi:hypothetical protein
MDPSVTRKMLLHQGHKAYCTCPAHRILAGRGKGTELLLPRHYDMSIELKQTYIAAASWHVRSNSLRC